MTNPPATRVITIGVDSHKDAHVAAAVDQLGRILATTSIPTTPTASCSSSAGPSAWAWSIGSGRGHRQLRGRVDPLAAAAWLPGCGGHPSQPAAAPLP
jgi:hypothetical protein